jgi:hypothetical protein
MLKKRQSLNYNLIYVHIGLTKEKKKKMQAFAKDE